MGRPLHVMSLVLAVSIGGAAAADQSTPSPPPKGSAACEAPSATLLGEVERLLKSAAEHASRSQVCVDGDGETTTIKVVSACAKQPLDVQLSYRVTIIGERGGECSPFPQCAEPPPPRVHTATATVSFAAEPDGVRVVVPKALPGVELLTPLSRKHSTGCHGDRAAFVPRLLKTP